MKTRFNKQMLVAVLAGLPVVTANAANLTIAKGSPHEAKANETYQNVYASDKITIYDDVTFKASTYTLQSDATADGLGGIDAVQIGAGASFYCPTIASGNDATGVVSFAGAGAKLDRSNDNAWYSTWFSSGKWELVDSTGDGIALSAANAWNNGNFNADGVSVRLTGSCDVKVSSGFTSNRAQGEMFFNRGFTFANRGKVFLLSSYWGTYTVNSDDVFAPSVSGVYLSRSGSKNAPVSLKVAKGKVASIKNLEAYDGGCCEGSGTVRMGEDDSDGVLKANVEGGELTVEKVGAGTLSVTVCTNIPSLVVKGGAVVLKSTMPVKRLSVADGATVTVDGVSIAVSETDAASLKRVSCINGGKVVICKGGEDDEYLRDGIAFKDGFELRKAGTGRTILCADSCADYGMYHLQDGQILFSKRGLTDRYLRFTFKKVLGWINYSNVLEAPGYLRLKQIALFKVDGTRTCHTTSDAFNYHSEHDGWSADQLSKGEISVNVGTTFGTTSSNWRCTPEGLFYINDGDWPVFNRNVLDNADDETTWQEVTVRLRDNVPALDGYSFQANYCNGLPTTWTVESSATGVDGSWQVIADEKSVQFDAAKKNHNAGWLDGYAAKGDGTVSDNTGRLAMYFNYVEPGVGSAGGSGATVELENGSVLDASNINGGLGVCKIIYDNSLGGGTLKNIRFLQSGVVEIVTSGGIKPTMLNIKVENPVDAMKLKDWQVTINGKTSSRQAQIVGGFLALQPRGLVLTVR